MIGEFVAEHGVFALVVACAGFFIGGFIKGTVGFALPLFALSINSLVLPAPLAVALLIVPALWANALQAFRRGPGAAMASLKRHRVLMGTATLCIALSAPLLPAMPERVFYLILGAGVLAFCLVRLLKLRLPDPSRAPLRWEAGIGAASGFFGGISGVWGPPILMYLIARNTPKEDHVTTTGLAFLLCAIAMIAAHSLTGVFTPDAAALSALAVLPALAGMRAGLALHDRLDQRGFARLTLILLALSGVNLLRRAAFG